MQKNKNSSLLIEFIKSYIPTDSIDHLNINVPRGFFHWSDTFETGFEDQLEGKTVELDATITSNSGGRTWAIVMKIKNEQSNIEDILNKFSSMDHFEWNSEQEVILMDYRFIRPTLFWLLNQRPFSVNLITK